MVTVTADEVRARIQRKLPEPTWQSQVIAYAEARGWLLYHTYNSKRSPSGFPDLVLLRGYRLVVAELKRQTGIVSPAQRRWLEAFTRASVEAYVWYPSDVEEMRQVLR